MTKRKKQWTRTAGLLTLAMGLAACTTAWAILLMLMGGGHVVEVVSAFARQPAEAPADLIASAAISADQPSATPTAASPPGETASPALTQTPSEPTVSPSITPTPTRTATPTRKPTPTRTPLPTPYPVPTGHITLIETRLHSAALNEDREIFIYLPPGYAAQSRRRYPVLYLLHGYGGFNLQNTTEWEQAGLLSQGEALINSGKIQPMIIVQPNGYMDGGKPSLFFNHGPGTDGKRFGDYVWQDVVHYVDANYRTIPRRESRAIGGISFGGQGALSLALTHPEVFKVIGADSPSFRGADGSLPIIRDWSYFNQFDPIWLVQNTNNARQLTIWLDVAANDAAVRNCGQESDRCVEAFHNLLVSKGIPHDWHDNWPGTHDWGTYWAAHIPDYLQWYSAKLVGG